MKKLSTILIMIGAVVVCCGITAFVVAQYFLGQTDEKLPSLKATETPQAIIPLQTDEPTNTLAGIATAEPTMTQTSEQATETPITSATASTVKPTRVPTAKPTATPTLKPTATPTVKPTATPTLKPTATPTVKPTATPTLKPTATPTVKPTVKPTATPTQALEGSDCLAYKLSSDGTYYICTGFDGFVYPMPSKIVIPAYYKNKPVKALGNGSLSDYSGSIKEIVISNGIERIEEGFFRCRGIESIMLPNSVKSIHGWAFRNCPKLETVYINTGGWKKVDYNGYTYESSCDFSNPVTAANILRSGDAMFFYVR